MYKIPFYRENVFVDESLNLYEDYKGIVIPYKNLLKSNGKLSLGEFGIKYDYTPFQLFRKGLLGLYLPNKFDIKFKDNDAKNLSVNNVVINNKPVTKIIEYRYNGLKNRTPQEKKLWEFINSSTLKTYFRKFWGNNRSKGKHLEFFEQSVFRSDKSFYLVDCIINGLQKGSLGLELDGSQHYTEDGLAYDLDRDMDILENYGVNLIRIPNKQFDSMGLLDFQKFLHDKLVLRRKALGKGNSILKL